MKMIFEKIDAKHICIQHTYPLIIYSVASDVSLMVLASSDMLWDILHNHIEPDLLLSVNIPVIHRAWGLIRGWDVIGISHIVYGHLIRLDEK